MIRDLVVFTIGFILGAYLWDYAKLIKKFGPKPVIVDNWAVTNKVILPPRCKTCGTNEFVKLAATEDVTYCWCSRCGSHWKREDQV